MKRYIRSSGWYTGEPSNFGKNGHSVYSNPENYKEKQTEILQFLDELAGQYKDGWYKPNTTNAIVQVQSKPCREVSDDNKYFKFDLWEDNESLDEQKDRFLMWADKYGDWDRFN